ncbi:DUF977 family protein [Xylella taiwanensis]|uniref:DUF977 family protein n=2 Tax=Xylella taiwanensis TaxID=1444770 RepID=A0ABS8TRH5_9GAMM|nr:hypothetical protein [Xylella taiwanensis]MCD8455270.1 DUF977 family protein [Xylella taiwanensis]MCD8457677.1 DUF977 family protein [Xylella taiwanensis]MCD8459814.1 DUF977 family protein [Xylella taiwanensis]MCD8464317.1 DUF977 family protein [Xylella taiwanensis]MCD8468122.1 DUF977 family protein [Xylella taiwanensis]
MSELSLQIVAFVREHGRMTLGKTMKLSRASRTTLKPHVRALVVSGTLHQHGRGRRVWYDLRCGSAGTRVRFQCVDVNWLRKAANVAAAYRPPIGPKACLIMRCRMRQR